MDRKKKRKSDNMSVINICIYISIVYVVYSFNVVYSVYIYDKLIL